MTPDELVNPDDLEICCTLNGEVVQQSRTANLVHDASAIVSYVSSVVTLLPGDVILTGTPGGVGFTRDPARYLSAGDTLVSTIEGIGELRTVVVGAEAARGGRR